MGVAARSRLSPGQLAVAAGQDGVAAAFVRELLLAPAGLASSRRDRCS